MSNKPNPSLLGQARKSRKLSAESVARFTKINEDRLVSFESGTLVPTVNQLTKLADIYNIPITSFYTADPLLIEFSLPDFRKENPSTADISPKGWHRLWQIERRANFVSDLTEALGSGAPKTSSIARLTNRSLPEAAEIRAGFDIWLSKRAKNLKFSGTKEDIFIQHLRLFLESRACSTAVNSAPIDDYIGFYNKISPTSQVIFVNRQVRNAKRRLFTLSHELAHFALDKEGISNPFLALNLVERQCNAFAAQFLAPDEQVVDIVRKLGQGDTKNVSKIANLVAAHTLLSRQAATIRLVELDLVSRQAASTFLKILNAGRRVSEPEAGATAPPKGRSVVVAKTLSEVGVLAAYTAAKALQHRIVDTMDVARGLGISEGIQADVLKLAEKRFEISAE